MKRNGIELTIGQYIAYGKFKYYFVKFELFACTCVLGRNVKYIYFLL